MADETQIRLSSDLTCPECGSTTRAQMPTDTCQFFFDCPACRTVLRPQPGDCCVFCYYATVPCPPIQQGGSCCD